MKTIHAFIFDLGKGGAQGVFVTLVNYLNDNGYRVETVLQTSENAVHMEELAEGIHITSLEVRSAKEMLPKLIRYFKNNHIELALAFSPEIAVNLYLAKRALNCKTHIIGRNINTLSVEFKYTDSFFRRNVTKNLIKLFYKKLDYIIAQSKGMAGDLVNHFGVSDEKIVVINNPLAKKYEDEIENLPVLKRENYILYVGRLERQKGLNYLLKAFSKIKSTDTKLFIVGSGSLREELVKMAKGYSINDRVEFIDFTSNVVEYYRKARLTVLTSLYEGFPNVLIESISCGTPVVAFDMPSGANEIINAENGIIVEYLNEEQLVCALDSGLDKEWNYRDIKETAKNYKEALIVQKYRSIFEEI